MVEKTPADYIAIYEPVMDSIVKAMYYRIAGVCSFHGNYEEMKNFIKAEVDIGKYEGTFEEDTWPFWFRPAKLLMGMVIDCGLWRDVNVSQATAPEEDKLTINIWVWGIKKLTEGAPLLRGDNVLFMRENWWSLYILRARFEDALGLPRHSFALFR